MSSLTRDPTAMLNFQRLASFFLLICTTCVAITPAWAGDESKPWTQISLASPKLSDPRQRQLMLIALDGKRDFSPETYYQLSPGVHEFALATSEPDHLGVLRFHAFTLDMQPCMNYEFVAVHEAATSHDNRHWLPKLKSARPIKRCVKKFKLSQNEQPPNETQPPVQVPAS